ncbi:MAG: hypothetical protein ACRCU0_06930 [Candidatus Rhabdochlamydia sp.]
MKHLLELTVEIGLFILFLATILKEFVMQNFFREKLPLLGCLLPSWSFFAPTPYKTDYFLFYRFIYEDDRVGEWKPVNKNLEKRPCYSFLWNPESRFLKGFIDIISDLIKCVRVMDKNQICASIPYLHLLHFVHSFPRDLFASKLQFVVISQSKLYNNKLVFLSEIHPFEKICYHSLN